VAGAHTVAELLVHIAHWKDVVRRRLEGDALPDANDTDWPPLEANATLRELRRRLEEAHGKLANCVAALDEAGLDAQVAGNRISREEIVHGILQHDVYHTGQLSLLVKALRGA
jgi:uncharacterized damage-inducible protein DinB